MDGTAKKATRNNMNFVITYGLKLLTAHAMKRLIVVALNELAKRTHTAVDDVAVEVIAEVLGVDIKKETN